MQLSETDIRELEAASAFGKRRMRFWMRATLGCGAAAFGVLALLVWADVLSVVDRYGELNAWLIFIPLAIGGAAGEALKRWYTPILVGKIAQEYDVTEESLRLATVDISDPGRGSGIW